MTLRNGLSDDYALVGASSPSAAAAELRGGGGAVQVAQAARIELPGGETVVLRPGGPSIRLTGLKRALAAADQVSVTLKLDGGSTLDVLLPVRDLSR